MVFEISSRGFKIGYVHQIVANCIQCRRWQWTKILVNVIFIERCNTIDYSNIPNMMRIRILSVHLSSQQNSINHSLKCVSRIERGHNVKRVDNSNNLEKLNYFPSCFTLLIIKYSAQTFNISPLYLFHLTLQQLQHSWHCFCFLSHRCHRSLIFTRQHLQINN